MKTAPKKKTSENAAEVQPAQSAAPVTNGVAHEDSSFTVKPRDAEDKVTNSVTLKVGPDGSVDSSVRPATWQKLAEVLAKTPGAKEKLLGIKSGAGLVSAEQIAPFYSGIGLLNAFLTIKLMHVSPEVAAALVPYNEEELKQLSTVTAEAVNENIDKIPAWLLNLLRGGGSVAFAKLAMVLFQVHSQKLAALRQAQQQQQVSGTASTVN